MKAEAETFDASVGSSIPSQPPDAPTSEQTGALPSDTHLGRKKRGRPFGSRNFTLTETPIIAEDAGETGPGEKPQRRKRAKPVDTAAWAKQLQGVHMLLAKMVPIQFQGKLLLEIDERESNQLATAIADVCKEYNIEIGGKVGAGFQLLATVAMIYGPRIYIVQQMKLHASRQAATVQPVPQSPIDVATARAGNGAAVAAN